MQKNSHKLRRWELALLLGVGLAAIFGLWLSSQQTALADKVIRLHIIANSDIQADQDLKLQVRDRILKDASPYLAGVNKETAERLLTARLDDLARAGAEAVGDAGYDYPVTASLEETYFPTKQYTDFAFPAGNYTALRVVIGDGEGKNWWCVVFPPLCLGSVTEQVETAAVMGELGAQDVALITGETQGYLVKFRAMELWEQFKNWAKR
ncbi:MAG: stage II sporulation protein R [Oscillospiraceae bacterium]